MFIMQYIHAWLKGVDIIQLDQYTIVFTNA